MDTSTSDDTSPAALRDSMVDRISHAQAIPPRVAEAMRTVPRHHFVPAAGLHDAYAEQAVITKRAPDGAPLSCASEPGIVAMMLTHLDVQPGDRILEIGAGTGYNAALLAALAGPTGQVTTIDIDPDVTAAARRNLDTAGYRHVEVITRDGAQAAPEHSPYNRIIVTVGAWDIPPTWTDQLTPGGRLVVPLRWRGQTRCLALTHHNGVLQSESVQLCGFVPMIGQDGERTGSIHPDGSVTLGFDADQPINPGALAGVLDQPKTPAWSGVTVAANEPFDGIWLRLTATHPGTCRIAVNPVAVETGLCTPAIPSRSPALANHDSVAYLTVRPHEPEPGAERVWELGATGHGPDAADLAARICDHIQAWNRNRTIQPVITIQRSDDQPTDPAGHQIAKPCTRIKITY